MGTINGYIHIRGSGINFKKCRNWKNFCLINGGIKMCYTLLGSNLTESKREFKLFF